MKIKTIAIVGLGLMGASLAAACRKRFPKSRIVGISRDPLALRLALKKRWIHQGFRQLNEGAASADLMVLCTPVDTVKPLLQKLDRVVLSGTVVTDTGSVKADLLKWVQKRRFRRLQFVGAHPMVGSHERGVHAARENLYDRGFTFVTKTRKTPARALTIAKKFWRTVSPKVVMIAPERHDQIAAEISHLPHLTAVCLMHSAAKKSLPFAGAGFLDATRMAQGHVSIWLPIFQANQKYIRRVLSLFEKQCVAFRKALGSSPRKLQKILDQAGRKRKQISLKF